MQTLIYRDPQRRAALAATGRAVYRARFAWEHTKHAYLAVYGVEEGDRRRARGDSRRSALGARCSAPGQSPARSPRGDTPHPNADGGAP